MAKKEIDILVKFLPVLAKVTGGYAAITDRNGKRIKTVNSSGSELTHLKDVVFDLAKEASESGEAVVGMSQLEYGAECWCLPMGEYVLCCSNTERAKRNHDLKEALIKSLPYISRVAGGEAVVFDSEGKRIASVDSKGNIDKKSLNIVSRAAKECMETQKPVIGKSASISGATAVRIPITKEFGFGFNNEDTVLKNQKLINEVKKYQYAKYNFSDIIGESPPMKRAKELAGIAARSNSSVLIFGETGTGKELFAHSIHNASERRNRPFVAINCAALPPSLIESHLFGYEGGAFTGAKREGSSGIFEQANTGTLFLDEISEMDVELQSKLLRVLQEKEVSRIGGSKSIPLDVRIIAATNKPLDIMVEKGQFRQDLFFRLNVIDIKLPPLRHIKEDIPLIIDDAITKMNRIFGKFVKGIEDSALEALLNYDWPGNVRELLNCIERAFNIIGRDEFIKEEHLSLKFNRSKIDTDAEEVEDLSLNELITNYEKKVIERVLKDVKGVKNKAAKRLKISTTTLWRKIKELGIED